MSDSAPASSPSPASPPVSDALKLQKLALLAESSAAPEQRVRAIGLLGKVVGLSDRTCIEALKRLATQTQEPDIAFHARRAIDEVRRRLAQQPSRKVAVTTPADVLQRLATETDHAVLFPLVDDAVRAKKPECLALMLKRLRKETDLHVVSKLTKAIGLFGEESTFEELCRYLSHPDSRVRANTIEGLAGLKTEERFKRVMPLIRDPDNRVRANAVRLLREYKHGDPANLLAEMLRSTNVAYRSSALFVLSKFKSPSTISLVRSALGDPELSIRIQAAEVLVELGENDGLDPIAALMQSGDEQERSLALAALKRLQERVSGAVKSRVDALVDDWFSNRYEIPAEESGPGTSDDELLMAQIDVLLDDGEEMGPAPAGSPAEPIAVPERPSREAAGLEREGAPHARGSAAGSGVPLEPGGEPAREERGRDAGSRIPREAPAPVVPETLEERPRRGPSPGIGEASPNLLRGGLELPDLPPLELIEEPLAALPVELPPIEEPPPPSIETGSPAAARAPAGSPPPPIAEPPPHTGFTAHSPPQSGSRPTAETARMKVPGGGPELEEGHVGMKFQGTPTEFDSLASPELRARLDELARQSTPDSREALDRASRSRSTEVRLEAKKRLQVVARQEALAPGGRGGKLAIAAVLVLLMLGGAGVAYYYLVRVPATPRAEVIVEAPPAPEPPAPDTAEPARPSGPSSTEPPVPPAGAGGGASGSRPVVVPATAPAVTTPAESAPVAAPPASGGAVQTTAPAGGSEVSVPATAPVELVSEMAFSQFEPLAGQDAHVLAVTHVRDPGGDPDAGWTPSRNLIAMVPGRSEVKSLTNDGESHHPVATPDGKRILFRRGEREGGELFVMAADGSDEQQLTSGLLCRHPSFSPGGNKAVAEALHIADGGAVIASNIVVIDLLAQLPISARDLFVGRGGRFLTSDGKARGPVWHPKLARIAYATSPEEPAGKVWLVGADGADKEELAAPGAVRQLRWSPSGEALGALVELTGSVKLFERKLGAAESWREILASASAWGAVTDFVWSPDGASMALTVEESGTDLGRLLLADTATGTHRILLEGARFTEVHFSEDGRRLLTRRADGPVEASLVAVGR